jgi:hypothetical protein
MSKHTLGPWAQNDTRVESEHEHGWANDGWILAGCEGPDAKANARLMAAAPDLLSVCKELADSAAYWSEYDVPLGIVDRLNAAIAKAEEI